MVTMVDHGNHRSNDHGNDRSNHRALTFSLITPFCVNFSKVCIILRKLDY